MKYTPFDGTLLINTIDEFVSTDCELEVNIETIDQYETSIGLS